MLNFSPGANVVRASGPLSFKDAAGNFMAREMLDFSGVVYISAL
jgi:hypothetical protein